MYITGVDAAKDKEVHCMNRVAIQKKRMLCNLKVFHYTCSLPLEQGILGIGNGDQVYTIAIDNCYQNTA